MINKSANTRPYQHNKDNIQQPVNIPRINKRLKCRILSAKTFLIQQ